MTFAEERSEIPERNSEPDMEFSVDRIALSIQQPWAELILRGLKTIEIRRTPARPQGPVYLYASRKPVLFSNLDSLLYRHGILQEALPLGVVVGTVEILDCRRSQAEDGAAALVPAEMLTESYSWILGNPQPFLKPLQPQYVPFGTWFYPFKRLQTNTRQRRDHGGI